MPAAQKASKGDPDTRAFLASLNLVEWGAALEAAKRLLIALDAPPVAPDALVRLQKLIRYHGEQYTTLVIRTVIESDGNELALIEPVISAVSDVMRRHPEWPEKGVAWIEAFDGIPLLQIVETMRGLEIFRETSIGTYLAVSLESRLARLFTISPAPEVAPPAKIPMSQARIPVILAKVRLGLELAALKGPYTEQSEVRRAGAGQVRSCGLRGLGINPRRPRLWRSGGNHLPAIMGGPGHPVGLDTVDTDQTEH